MLKQFLQMNPNEIEVFLSTIKSFPFLFIAASLNSVPKSFLLESTQ